MKNFLFFNLIFWCCTSLLAVPAKKGAMTIKQPDGTIISVSLKGDEHLHYYETSDGIIIKKDSTGFYKYAEYVNNAIIAGPYKATNSNQRTTEIKKYLESKKITNENKDLIRTNRFKSKQTKASEIHKSAIFNPKGNGKVLVLLVEFKDNSFSRSDAQSYFTKQINGDNFTTNGALGSVRQYFKDQSYNTFNPQFDVVGPIKLEKNMAEYGGNNNKDEDIDPAGMVVDACSIANSKYNVDFSNYDLDSDGLVDLVYVIYAGYSEAQGGSSNTIWPHQWDVYSAGGYSKYLNNKMIYRYACNSELNGSSGSDIDGIGTFCHEFSHCIGLPDFYVTDETVLNFGMGEWDLMDYGCYGNDGNTPVGYSAYEKMFMNWIEPHELTSYEKVTLQPLTDSKDACIIYNPSNKNEYIIFENRQLKGWDSYVPNSGMLISSVNYSEDVWESNAVNNTQGKQRMSLIPADNKLLIYDGDYTAYINSLKGDSYPGTSHNTEFTDTSIPAAKFASGIKVGKPITKITETNGVVSFLFMEEKLETPSIRNASQISTNSFLANWNVVDKATSYSLQLVEATNTTNLLSENFDKFTEYSGTDITSSVNTYTQTSGWSGQKLFCFTKQCKIGSNKTAGYIITPMMDCNDANGIITIYFDLASKDANKSIEIELLSSTKTSLNKQTLSTTSTSTRYCVVFNNVPEKAYVKLSPSDVAYIDNLNLYTTDCSASEPSSSASSYTPIAIFENIQENSHLITGLNPENTYSYRVMALGDVLPSEWSEFMQVTTSSSTDVKTINNDNKIKVIGNQIYVYNSKAEDIRLFNLNGMLLFDGIITDDSYSISFTKGLYILKVGNFITKVLIK